MFHVLFLFCVPVSPEPSPQSGSRREAEETALTLCNSATQKTCACARVQQVTLSRDGFDYVPIIHVCSPTGFNVRRRYGQCDCSWFPSDLCESAAAGSEGFKHQTNLTLEQRDPRRSRGLALTWSLGFDDGLRRNAHAALVERQLAAGQAVGPAVIVADHHRLAARLGPLAHGLARFNGLMLKVDCADGSVHGAEEEEQIWTAAGT